MVLSVQEVQPPLDIAEEGSTQEVCKLQDSDVEQTRSAHVRQSSGFWISRKRLRHVYLIRMGTWQRPYPVWKIGVADDARERFVEIAQAYRVSPKYPLVPQCYFFAECWAEDAVKIEAYLHDHFAEHRMEGEWFHLSEEMIDSFFMRCERWPVPWPAILHSMCDCCREQSMGVIEGLA